MNKMKLTAELLPILTEVRPDISMMSYAAESDAVIVFFKDGSILRIPTPGSGFDLIKAVVNAL